MLKRALDLAYLLHKDQVDKSGKPYFFHPMYVAMQFTEEKEQVVALLHDIVEDTDLTVEGIEGLFNKEIAEAVDAISRRKNEKYFDYIERVKTNPIAHKVKIEDLKHNLSNERMDALDKEEAKSLKERYSKALNLLTLTIAEEFKLNDLEMELLAFAHKILKQNDKNIYFYKVPDSCSFIVYEMKEEKHSQRKYSIKKYSCGETTQLWTLTYETCTEGEGVEKRNIGTYVTLTNLCYDLVAIVPNTKEEKEKAFDVFNDYILNNNLRNV